MAGGLTVEDGGTIDLPSTGDIAIGADKIITMNGTLAASNTGAIAYPCWIKKGWR